MQFKNIDEVLSPKHLRNPDLEVLYPDVGLYQSSIFQPLGHITGNTQEVKNVNHQEACEKHTSFLRHASQNQVAVAVTPEYSCPWAAIDTILEEDLFPAEGKLWIIGCESVTPTNLSAFTRKFEDRLEIIHEDFNTRNGNFLDPVCYIFQTKNQNGELKKVILIQFKTKPMGDAPEHFERDNLILGNNIYIFRGSGTNTIRLVTFICSDVLGITNDEIREVLSRSLIVHIQLNPNPRSTTFSQYRAFCFDALGSDCEVLCVNWAKDVVCNESDPQCWGNISGSCLYIKSDAINTTDTRINQNHAKGIYLTYWQRYKTYSYFFNYQEHIFLFRSPKAWQFFGTNQQAGRNGPEIIDTLQWDTATNSWNSNPNVDDGFNEHCRRINGDLSSLTNLHDKPTSIEKLLTLSAGEAQDNSWLKIERLSLFKIKQDEIIQRISFAQDPHTDAVSIRDKYLNSFAVLNEITLDQNNFPRTISNLKQNCTLNYMINEPHRNLYGGVTPATVVYIGENPVTGLIQKTYSDLKIILDRSNCDSNRLVVWYRDIQGRTKFYPEEIIPNVDRDPTENPALITRG